MFKNYGLVSSSTGDGGGSSIGGGGGLVASSGGETAGAGFFVTGRDGGSVAVFVRSLTHFSKFVLP